MRTTAFVLISAALFATAMMRERTYVQTRSHGAGPRSLLGRLHRRHIPWIAITVYLIGPDADAHPPGFVYAIFFSLFLAFNCFAVNQWLQYTQLGKWKDYLVGERAYVTLSLVAKSLLAWQIFAATLASSTPH